MTIDLETQLRNYAMELDGRAADVETILADLVRDDGRRHVGPVGHGRRGGSVVRWRRSLLALGAAFFATALLVGVVMVATSGSDPAPGDVASAPARLYRLTTDDIPPMRAFVAYQPGFDDEGESRDRTIATAEILYSPGEGYRMLARSGGPSAPAAGSYFVWDGQYQGWYDAAPEYEVLEGEQGASIRFSRTDPVYPPNWQSDFSGRCTPDAVTPLGPRIIADRPALGLVCSKLAGEWTMWVDEATGIILRLEGQYSGRDDSIGLSLGPSGWFEVQLLELNPKIDAGDFSTEGLDDATDARMSPDSVAWVPPFRAVVSISESSDTASLEVWYQDAAAWEVRTIESTGGLADGPEVEVQLGDQLGFPTETAYGYSIQNSPPGFPGRIQLLVDGARLTTADECTSAETAERLGRSATVYECTSAGPPSPQTVVIDDDTGLVLLYRDPVSSFEVLELEIDPDIPADVLVFDFSGERLPDGPEPPPQPLVGGSAPALVAPLLDGSEFDLAELRGRRVAVLFWASWCPPCLDAVERMREAEQLLGSDVTFVAVASRDERSAVADLVARAGLRAPVPLDPDGSIAESWLIEGYPWLLLVDADGTVVAGHVGAAVAKDIMTLILDAPWW